MTTFRKTVSRHLWKKFQTQERVEWWWKKFHSARRRRVWKLSEQQNHRCCYCSRPTWVYDDIVNRDVKYASDRLPGMTIKQMATADHIIPDSEGGSEHISNLVMCCMRCNDLRGNKDALAFWETMQSSDKLKAHFRQTGRFRKQLPKITESKAAKKQQRQTAIALWIGYLASISPEWRMAFNEAFAAATEKIAEEDAHWQSIYGDLIHPMAIMESNQMARAE